ncbi:MAG TPA: hypothetical protein VK766_12180 [Cytophagaceae bacterium]|jgi:hypothetical protein|nr:hypothetical protein [Cytophagaceae bacterium]
MNSRFYVNNLLFFYTMNNDPELSGKYLGSITKDFVKIADTLKDASYQIRVRGISKYPIFPISKIELPIGQVFLGINDIDIEWNYNISFLDEFVQRQLIGEEKIGDFEEAYKNPDEFCCLFVVDVDFTNFVFIPYPED